MSLQHAAKHLAAHGRGPDTELIHMTKGEVAGLQALAKSQGGSLTINPHTGLPEASFLSSMLPTVLGAGAMFFSGGAINPATIGLLTGGLQWARTGSLGKGLLAGMGAYGGAGLAGGLMASGAATASGNVATQAAEQQAAAETAKIQAENAAATANEVGMSSDALGSQAGQQAAQQQTAQQAAQQQLAAEEAQRNVMSAETQGLKMGEAAQQSLGRTPGATFGENLSNRASGMWEGAKGLAADSDVGRNAFSDYATANGGLGKLGLAAATPAIANSMAPKTPEPVKQDTDMGPRYSYSPGTANPFPSASPKGSENPYFPGQKYTRLSDADAKALYGFAAGGDIQGNDPNDIQGDPNMMNVRSFDPVVRMAKGRYITAEDTEPMKKPKGLRDMPGLESGDDLRDTKGLYAAGGMSHLGDYSDGGRLLRGPGDGVSDSIPANIGGKRPARLADGEFVVPARIVSELGNGSTEAGARQLYAMMDRVQKDRRKTVGKGKIAKNTNAAKQLPA